jgi:hypothetical protein
VRLVEYDAVRKLKFAYFFSERYLYLVIDGVTRPIIDSHSNLGLHFHRLGHGRSEVSRLRQVSLCQSERAGPCRDNGEADLHNLNR